MRIFFCLFFLSAFLGCASSPEVKNPEPAPGGGFYETDEEFETMEASAESEEAPDEKKLLADKTAVEEKKSGENPGRELLAKNIMPEEESPAAGYNAYVRNAENLFAEGDWDGAFREFGKASESIKLEDARQVYILSRQGAALTKQGNCSRAKKFYASAVGIAKKISIAGEDMVSAYLGLAFCQGKDGNIKWAVANYKAALERTAKPDLKKKIESILSRLGVLD